MFTRRQDGDETWNRLLNWTKGQKSSERLAAHILSSEGFKSIDPSHPLGGKDGLKDIISFKDNLQWIAAAYFPRGQKTFAEIKKKFIADSKGIKKNNVSGLVLLTNQELTLRERKNLKDIGKPQSIEIFHLERITHILDTPKNYGLRLEFLDIELTKEEQLSYFASRDQEISDLSEKLEVTIAPQIWKGALASAKKMEEKYGEENLWHESDFEWGMLNGKVSALRWILGDDWDLLDT